MDGAGGDDALWVGAAGVCVDAGRRALLVLQGGPADLGWAIPAGGRLAGESVEQCCLREVWVQTGYRVALRRRLHVKTGAAGGRPFALFVFEVAVRGGAAGPRDPDGLIRQVAWRDAAEIERLAFCFPEDRAWLLGHLRAAGAPGDGEGAKLVRDGIPQLAARQGRPARFRLAGPGELPALLLAKVGEEAAEVVASGGGAGEIADLLEVLDALAERRGYSAQDIRRARQDKRRSRGALTRGWVMSPGPGPDGQGAAAGRGCGAGTLTGGRAAGARPRGSGGTAP